MHSISDLTTLCRRTTGDVPPKLVGASTTVVGSKMYLFGGRLVSERRMLPDLYVFDLQSFVWQRIAPFPEDEAPAARYFHSADTWNDMLIIFGGMGTKSDASNPDDLCILSDVRFFDLSTRHWLPVSASNRTSEAISESMTPKPRYAHLSAVTADRLFIIGGQDLNNVWLDDVYVYDLLGKAWIQRRDYPRHCGTYRSVAVSANMRVRLPHDEVRTPGFGSNMGPPGTRFRPDKEKSSQSSSEFSSSQSLIHLPYSASPTDTYPNDIYLYSNYNFTDVKRELEVFSPLPDMDFTINDRSTAMTGTSFPPGLRFPAGAILGTHFIVAGTYIAHTYQSFSIWALDLLSMTWSRIDPGNAVSSGSWFRGCLWPEANSFLIFGNRHGNLVEDYNRRLLSWDHVAMIDLEAFGIYQPPQLQVDIPMQELGLSALEEGVLTDFEIVCDDGRKVRCSKKILEERWPWFKHQLHNLVDTAKRTAADLSSSAMDAPLPDLPGATKTGEKRFDPRLTPRSFHLSEPYPITLALLQYFYTTALLTPLQHAPAVLSQLLVLATTYEIWHLQALVQHAMHRALSNSTSVGVYEVATLCSCRSLQIRALKTVMSYSQKRPANRTRQDKSGGGGSRYPDAGGGSTGGPSGHSGDAPTARPRGTSDARFRSLPNQYSGSSVPNRGYAIENSERFAKLPSISRSKSAEALPQISQQQIGHKQILAALDIDLGSFPMPHTRTASAVSTTTDNELIAVAELLSPVITVTRDEYAEQQEQYGVAVEDEEEFVVYPVDGTDSIQEYPRKALASASYNNRESLPSYPPLSPSSRRSSYSESDYEPSLVDDYYLERSPIHPVFAYPAFHLPRSRRTGSRRESNTPSLTSTSSASASSTNLSQLRQSPPPSPILLKTPVDAVFGSPHLTVIEERGFDEQEIPYPFCAPADDHEDHLSLGYPGHRIGVSSDSQATLKAPKSPQPFLSRPPRLSRLYINPQAPSSSGSSPSQPSTGSSAVSPRTPSRTSLRPRTADDFIQVESRSPSSSGFRLARSSSSSATSSSDSGTAVPASPSTLRLSLSRILPTRTDATRAKTSRRESSIIGAAHIVSPLASPDSFDTRLPKADAKRARKIEMDRLAQDLKERQRVRAEQKRRQLDPAVSLAGTARSGRGALAEQASMYGGLANITL